MKNPRFISVLGLFLICLTGVQGAVAPNNPVGDQLLLHLDGEDASSVSTTNGYVTQWSDQTGTYSAVQGTAANRPTYNASEGVVFDGSNDFLENTGLPLDDTKSMYFVITRPSTGDTGITLFDGYDDYSGYTIIDFQSGNYRYYGGQSVNLGGFKDTRGETAMYSSVQNGNTVELFGNGGSLGTGTPGTRGATGYVLGDDHASYNGFFDGTMHEVLVYDKPLNGSEQDEVEGYLAAKWGFSDELPESHPYHDAINAQITTETLRTYLGNQPQAVFPKNSTVIIEVNGTASNPPSITITNNKTSSTTTMQGSNGVYTYNHTANTTGWHTVTIQEVPYTNTFYVGETWDNKYSSGEEEYTFSAPFNVTEPGTAPRWLQPLTVPVNFTFQPSKSSITVLQNISGDVVEMPSQVLSATNAADGVTAAEILIPYTGGLNSQKSFFVTSRKPEVQRNTTNMTVQSNAGVFTVTHKGVNSTYTSTNGGLLENITEPFLKANLGGTTPTSYYPQLDEGLSTYTARIDSTSTVDVTQGPLRTRITTTGNMNDLDAYPYRVTCDHYAFTRETKCVENITVKRDATIKNFYASGVTGNTAAFTTIGYNDGATTQTGITNTTTSSTASLEWAGYLNNETNVGFATTYDASTWPATNNPAYEVTGGTTPYHRAIPVDAAGVSVQENTSYIVETTRTVFNAVNGWNNVERYVQRRNPVTVQFGSETTNDAEPPTLQTLQVNGSTDTANFTVTGTITDDTYVDTVQIVVNGSTAAGTMTIENATIQLRENGSLTNSTVFSYTVQSTKINAGNITARITATDIVGKTTTNETSTYINDTTPPQINITFSPNTSAELDPNKTVIATVTIEEYTGVSTVDFEVDNQTTPLQSTNTSGNTYTYQGNFSTNTSKTVSYTVRVADTENRTQSLNGTVPIEYDATWNTTASLNNTLATFNTDTYPGTITFNNTGDLAVNLTVTAGVYNERIKLGNQTLPVTITLSNGTVLNRNVTATTRDPQLSEGVDAITLEITAGNTSRTKAFNVVTSTGGPFLDITLNTPENVDENEAFNISTTLTNRGNETAENVDVNLTTNPSITPSNTPEDFFLTIPVGFTEDVLATYAGVQPGTYDVVVTASTDNATWNTTKEFTVSPQSTTTEVSDRGSSSGGGGGGGFSGSSGGASERGETTQIITQNITVITGNSSAFQTTFTNPFKEGTLENIDLEVTGNLSRFLELSPERIAEMLPNETRRITVNITTPTYIKEGIYDVILEIRGTNNLTETVVTGDQTIQRVRINDHTTTKKLRITVHRVPEQDAENALRNASQKINDSTVPRAPLRALLKEMQLAYEAEQMSAVLSTKRDFEQLLREAQTLQGGIEELNSSITESQRKGIEAKNAQRLLELATLSYERGDFEEATSRLREAESTYALETKGVIPWKWWVKNHVVELAIGATALILLVMTTSYVTKRVYYTRKIHEAEEQKNILLGLIQQTQKECFEDKTLGMDEYLETIQHYETRLADAITQKIEHATKKANLASLFSSEQKQLRAERKRIQDELRDTQKRYLEDGQLESRIYNQTMKQFRDRLSEIEGRLAELEVEKQL